MIFTPGKVYGSCVIELQKRADERGFFARSWCAQELAQHGLNASIAQINVANTFKRGTVRGMHFQTHPHCEVKIVSCTRGAIFDVMVDLRKDSPTYAQWFGVELTAENRKALYVPEGCAHGYQTLCDDADIQYLTSRAYAPQHATGIRYDDATIGVQWPLPVSVISEADLKWGTLQAARDLDLRP